MTMKSKPKTDRWAILVVLSLMAATLSHAFVAQSTSRARSCHKTFTSLNALPEANPFLLVDGLSAATYMGVVDSNVSSLSGPLSALRTFFIVIAASIFGITAIVYLTAAFLVPKAAEELERDTKRLRPGLWEEYEAKLEDGESMVNRPDLLQELGNVMQPIILKGYENEAAAKFDGKDTKGADSTMEDRSVKGDIIDVTVKQPEDK
mmetsp:Transcript_37608/g.80233  ORF Transcript_37608/g.80233 Transcript_37608/m.80233 type:complete len:206 (+) Transcript_37608:64-681(+)|eukprot:CAMPEP_0172526102 /NCGR_PEP_ID=MMETSP1067-20121228/1100_1 /TAXON_ID=265564 ORGANISM="Thalassiosira punctigera, Strain Tpunct2005C2" /NCGR_SAMPLE_ID=MMETSP1067 /ASSEMBLY_ACC=CAM_ASM_000444 /LENGTH=205 /DNA_ID=CAMNT_0013309541 /DNA_START=14 /DNA_END=631 /DNA_ORIENTATION=+